MKSTSLDQLKDKHIGISGSEARINYELELSVDIMRKLIKQIRKEKGITQEELGKIVGVQKAQISKLESNVQNVTLATILKVFKALQSRILFRIEVDNAA
ncbi:MAG: helix-turn-helix transcriptional regulator [Flavobacteriales bacterium]|nr:helix-turn-helix transcriptional regulator [Flavobacteriales bacterium]